MMFLLPHTTVNIRDYLPENTQVNGGVYDGGVYVVPSQGNCAKIWAQAVHGSYDTLKITRTERWNKQIQTISWQVVLDPSQQTLPATQSRRSHQVAVC